MEFRTVGCLPASQGKRFSNPLIGGPEQDIIRDEHRKLMRLAALVCGVTTPTYEDVDAKIKELETPSDPALTPDPVL